MSPLYTAICLAVLFDPIGTTIIQTDVFDSCKWKCLLFAQLWPGSFCMTLPKQDCRIPDHVEGWTIHGLWPSGRRTCNHTWHLTHEDIDDLQVDLFLHWPSLTNTDAFKFWGNEWIKHGTCAACADSMSCPHKYFSLALQLQKQFAINEAFIAAGITPSCDNSYKLEHFHSALTDMGTHVEFQCCTLKKRQVLMQIKVPLSKDLSIGCNHTEEHFSNQYYHPCTNKAEIYFYPFTHHPHNPCP
ncbi:ribonuclease T2-like [Leucoraja erinacea]|uniref:ribonuclease T2-like n=1 Tax=Leucoraja erinaceus TaxID=7782 RepID=UPI0024542108|nr:ribonuclease T2-like [Leucoraja erinacea]